MNQTTAIANARFSSLYSQGVTSYYQPTFNSIFQIDSTISTSTCEQQVESYNVVFVLHNSTGSVVANLVISESQGLAILGSSIQPDQRANTVDSEGYAGYDASPGSGIDTYASYIEYNQSDAQYPSTGCENDVACEVSTWTGLTDQSNGDGDIVQDGTTGECGPSSTCTASYFAWYETFDASTQVGAVVDCVSGNNDTTVSSDNTIETNVINNVLYSESDSTYSINIDDVTSNTSCYAGDISFSTMTAPTYAEWITELPYDGPTDVSLAKFGTVSFTGLDLEDASTGSNISPYTAYQNGDTETFRMYNGTPEVDYPFSCTDVQNVNTNTITSSGFTTHWLSSEYTRGSCD
jgi:hypothetical protein